MFNRTGTGGLSIRGIGPPHGGNRVAARLRDPFLALTIASSERASALRLLIERFGYTGVLSLTSSSCQAFRRGMVLGLQGYHTLQICRSRAWRATLALHSCASSSCSRGAAVREQGRLGMTAEIGP